MYNSRPVNYLILGERTGKGTEHQVTGSRSGVGGVPAAASDERQSRHMLRRSLGSKFGGHFWTKKKGPNPDSCRKEEE